MMMRRSAIVVSGLVLLGMSFGSSARAAEAVSTRPYSGAFFDRSTLTGDWGGARNDLAAKGITFDANLTQIEQGVVSGGKNGSWEYGGRGDLTGNLDPRSSDCGQADSSPSSSKGIGTTRSTARPARSIRRTPASSFHSRPTTTSRYRICPSRSFSRTTSASSPESSRPSPRATRTSSPTVRAIRSSSIWLSTSIRSP